jgi:general L-amino acid transport system substrate-binding protein
MSRKLLFVFSILIAISLLATACSSPQTQTPASTSGEVETAQTVEVVKTVIVTVEVPVQGTAVPPEVIKPAGYGETLAAIQSRGKVVCGVHTELLGFGYLDENGRNIGFDIDFCRAVAAAVLGDPEAIEAVPITAADRGPVLQTGEVDLVTRNMTWTSKRDAEWGNFTWITFYDGQGFLVRKDSGITSLEDMDGATVCVTTGTTTEKNLATAFGDAGLSYEAVTLKRPPLCTVHTRKGAATWLPVISLSWLPCVQVSRTPQLTRSCLSPYQKNHSPRPCQLATTSGWISSRR